EPFFVMEYVEGASLGDMVKKYGRCSNEDFIQVFGQALKALNYIHRKNVIHRDIKSSNIMMQVIEGDRYVKLLDFGIAKVLADSGVTMQQLTATGEAIGSPLYMSPEQCRGNTVDSRADIYSLGCVMYECFAGQPPFKGENAMQTIQMHLNESPRPLAALCRSEQELQIASLIHRCILKDPEHRFQNAADLAVALEETTQIGTQVKAIARPANSSMAAGGGAGL
ncbi:MAG: serine/threonine protein kinase, partial [Cyanobacteria bacterium HKST-UBA01]|nr:serine/threonine protein kinase [Cyanobacteria bacterium HKST-UBA01]